MISKCWARMLSWKVTLGKGRRKGVFEGEELWLFPKRAGMMMWYLEGFRVLVSPISQLGCLVSRAVWM